MCAQPCIRFGLDVSRSELSTPGTAKMAISVKLSRCFQAKRICVNPVAELAMSSVLPALELSRANTYPPAGISAKHLGMLTLVSALWVEVTCHRVCRRPTTSASFGHRRRRQVARSKEGFSFANAFGSSGKRKKRRSVLLHIGIRWPFLGYIRYSQRAVTT